jgi:hypothetical protein
MKLVFENEKNQKITTFPVYPNKWRFYLGPLAEQNNTSFNPLDLEFNWFLCSKPCTKNNEKVIEVGKYSLFFDPNTGISYYVKFDVNECILKLINPGILSPESNFEDPYCGVAMITPLEKFPKGQSSCYKDLVCSDAVLIFRKDVLEATSKCPYIDFARAHSNHLRKNIKSFPSETFLKNAKPGKDSLYLRELIRPYLLQ